MTNISSMNYPEIDLSLVTFNSARWIEDFIASLRTQHYPLGKIHVFVRDNGSTDETIAIFEQVRQQDIGFASFQLEMGENVGFGRGHNVNLGKGHSPYFLVSNIDLTIEAEAINKIVTQALSDGSTVASWEFRQKPFEHPKYYNPVTMHTTWSSGACTLFRREAIARIGGYEPRIFMYGEDVELSYRLRAEGYALKYAPQAVCWHHTYETAHEIKPLQFLGSKLGNAYIRLRYGQWWQALEILPLFVALLLLPQRFSGQRAGVLKAGAKVLRNAPYFLSTRKAGSTNFPLSHFDYERCRPGAFYENRPLPAQTPLVSVIVRTCKGQLACLKEAVTSILNQTYPNIELLVVEDGLETSRDFILEIAARGVLTSVRYLNIEKTGRSKAGNAAMAVAAGEYLCFIDDGDLLFADHVEVLAQEMLTHPNAGAVYGVAWQIVTREKTAADPKYRQARYNLIYGQSFSQALLFHKNFIPIQAILFKKTLYQEMGGFSESLEYLEDWELWVRYAATHEFVFVPKLTSLYRIPDSSAPAVFRRKDFVAECDSEVRAVPSTRVTATHEEIKEMAGILAKSDSLFKIRRISARIFSVALPCTNCIYKLLAKSRKAD